MKKIIAMFTVLAFMLNVAVAQEATKKNEKAENKVEKPKKVEKAEVAEPAKPDMQQSKSEGGKLKKDGTPDKRYKENKEAKTEAKPAGPLKKDGTPDMRHKANKEAAKTK